MKPSRRVLVTGGNGLIGAPAIRALRAAGFEVVATSRTREGREAGVDWRCVNLLDPTATASLIEDTRPTHLLHLAWETTHGHFWAAESNLDWVAASLCLVRAFAAHGGQRIVIGGTCAEYASTQGDCIEGGTPLVPETLYGVSKHALHQIVSAFAAQIPVSFAWGRVFFVYGPGEHQERLVPSISLPLLRGQKAVCLSGHLIRDWLHVEDAGRAFVAVLGSDITGPVNIASGTAVAIAEIATDIAEAVGREDLIEFAPRVPGSAQPLRVVADAGRLRHEVGWVPTIELQQGLAETVDWWRTQLARNR